MTNSIIYGIICLTLVGKIVTQTTVVDSDGNNGTTVMEETVTPPPTLASNETTMAVVEDSNSTTVANAEATTHAIEDSNSTTVAHEEATTHVMEDSNSTTVAHEEATTHAMEDSNSTTVAHEEATTYVMEDSNSTTVAHEEATTHIMEDSNSTTVAHEEATTHVMGESNSTTVAHEEATTPVVEDSNSTAISNEEATTHLMEESNSTAMPDEAATTHAPTGWNNTSADDAVTEGVTESSAVTGGVVATDSATNSSNVQPTEPAEKEVTIVSASITLDAEFTEELNNPASVEFQSLANDIEESATPALNASIPGFVSANVTGFREGSVIAIIDITIAVTDDGSTTGGAVVDVDLDAITAAISSIEIPGYNITGVAAEIVDTAETAQPTSDNGTDMPTEAPDMTTTAPEMTTKHVLPNYNDASFIAAVSIAGAAGVLLLVITIIALFVTRKPSKTVYVRNNNKQPLQGGVNVPQYTTQPLAYTPGYAYNYNTYGGTLYKNNPYNTGTMAYRSYGNYPSVYNAFQ